MSSFQKVLPPSIRMSPEPSRPVSSAMAASVISPAGSISQTTRGGGERLHQVGKTVGGGGALAGQAAARLARSRS